ncbi:16S rRNA (cytosine(967)-C(5))-methyltransferase [Secundilactobacillus paracollinoides]|uniref:16S rRNA (cytosine(967)-C(5))-methyltransferase RsmB n=1 Tax=Secundilactobacillus paracollinoides TaxID=240427 RepID=UPI00081A6682|nr:16S rRNA (cytosine(967)-C(5))-methyltransferase RsmB [Secundilactobacillus paracollinoides]ANZ63817.1 16S rRNA (cytosine(967)-C(5))-methyltransferase [Secundilactobacillus paracollinoides]
MTTPDTNPRSLAVTALMRIQKGAYSNLQLNQMLDDTHLDPRDASLLTTIVYGVIQHQLTIDYQLKPFIQKPNKLQPWVKVLLETAIYQWQYLERVPKRAIFNETIDIAKKRGHEGIRRFVTGVLHQMDRSGLPDPSEITDQTQRWVTQYSVPEWLITSLLDQRGAEKTEAILKVINQPANQSVRVNRTRLTVAQATEQLQADGYDVTASAVSENGLVLNGKPANHAELFKQGDITIQDESAMLPAESMHVKANQEILDACAAPGGKTVQLAESVDESAGGQVTALDIHQHKVRLITQNAKRMGVSDRVDAVTLDARKVDDMFADGLFDQILVDAPCSGIGLVRRKPEIRYEKQLRDSEALAKVQLAILNAVATKVTINGIITYSTCTILNQENRDVVAAFLAAHPDFVSQRVHTAHDLKADRETDYLEIYPDDYGSDGFFISQFKRIR